MIQQTPLISLTYLYHTSPITMDPTNENDEATSDAEFTEASTSNTKHLKRPIDDVEDDDPETPLPTPLS